MLPSLLCFFASIALAAGAQPPAVWPLPRQISEAGKAGVINPTAFEFKATGTSSVILTKAFKRFKVLCFPPNATSPPAVAAATLEALDVNVASGNETLGIATSENHTLTITFPRATLTADTVYGALRGLETFSQLLHSDMSINEQTVVDWPRFPHRGVMIDSSRHFLPVQAVLGFVEAMSYSKLNVLHWHLTDAQSFPVESTSAPNLTAGAFDISNECRSLVNIMPNETNPGWHRVPQHPPLTRCTYTHEDLRAVVAFAKDRGVRVVPEFDTPAHAASWVGGG